MISLDQHGYEALRERVRAKDARVALASAELRGRAADIQSASAEAVTDKKLTPHSPSQDLHDYVSIATYWWPNPKTADGLPYVRRDGQLSPDLELYDRGRWARTADAIVTLIRAAYLFDDASCAKEAAARARRWFVDPGTRMNPHLKYGQMIPGRDTGRQFGIVDFALYLPPVLDHLRLLAAMPESPWTAEDQQAMGAWSAEFLQWLQSHKYGKAEEAAANNHGVYYDRLVVSLALFADRRERARAQLVMTRNRIDQQIRPDGSMPHELGRTCSFGYTVMNTRAFVDLAYVGRQLGVELWPKDDTSTGIASAVDFLYRHCCSRETWPHQQIEEIDWRMVCPVFTRAAALSGTTCDLAAMGHRFPEGFSPDCFPMVEPIHPFGKLRSPRAE